MKKRITNIPNGTVIKYRELPWELLSKTEYRHPLNVQAFKIEIRSPNGEFRKETSVMASAEMECVGFPCEVFTLQDWTSRINRMTRDELGAEYESVIGWNPVTEEPDDVDSAEPILKETLIGWFKEAHGC